MRNPSLIDCAVFVGVGLSGIIYSDHFSEKTILLLRLFYNGMCGDFLLHIDIASEIFC